MKKRGILYGVGVGPGDPELLTIKAIKAVEKSDIIILPTELKEECYAYQIIKQMIPNVDEKRIVCKHFPMIRDSKELVNIHDKIYVEIRDYLLQEHSVAFLTIGDPSLYATYGYIHRRAERDGIETSVISGIPSVFAAAGQLGIPLAESNEEIHIIPGAEDVLMKLNYPGTKVFMKSGKNLTNFKNLLQASEDKIEVWAVTNCGLPSEKCMYGLEQLDDECGYLTTIIVKERKLFL